MQAVVSTKGRVIIPAELRRKFGIEPGIRIAIEQKGNTIMMRPITPAYIDSIQGVLQRKPGEKPVTLALVEEHAAEVAGERGRS